MFFIVQDFQSSGFSESRFFRVQVFLGLGYSGPGFSGSGSRVWVQVLEVAKKKKKTISRSLLKNFVEGFIELSTQAKHLRTSRIKHFRALFTARKLYC